MKKEKGTDRISTFIGADASIDGKIDFKGTIRVDGKVKGKITSNSGTVVVGEKAVVNAELHVNVAVIMVRPITTAKEKKRYIFAICGFHFELCFLVLLQISKFAVTVRLACMIIVTGFPVPEKPPDQPVNWYPLSATAFRITFWPRS